MKAVFEDIRYSARLLLRAPGFTLVAIAVLALAIGANCLVFSVVDAVLLRPFPYRAPERLVFLWSDHEVERRYASSFPKFLDWRARNQVFENMGAWMPASFDLTEGPYPDRVSGTRATASFFSTLGVSAKIGRTFLPEEEYTGSDHVVLLSYRLWQARFHGDPKVVGSAITLSRNEEGGQKHTVIGVLPPSLQAAFPTESGMWAPVALDGEEAHRRDQGSMYVIARLKPGVTLARAGDAMRAIAAAIATEHPDTDRGWSVNLVPFHTELTGDNRTMLLSLAGAVAFVLLIGCANLANLTLARATDREREMTIRAAVGASRLRLVRLILTESLSVALLGGMAGALVAFWSVGLVKAIMPSGILRGDTIGVDIRALLFTLGISMLTGIMFGLAPALRASRSGLNLRLQAAGSRDARSGARLRSALVVSEIALGLVLLTGAGLMINSLIRLLRVDPGLNPHDLMSIQTYLPRERYTSDAQRLSFMRQLLGFVKALPGVRYAGLTDFRPIGSSMNILFQKQSEPGVILDSVREIVAGDYFPAMGTRLVSGRLLTSQDDASAPAVALVNETAARRYWPGENPIGKRITIGLRHERKVWKKVKDRKVWEIVGVVADVRRAGPQRPAGPAIYTPQAQEASIVIELVVRTQPGVSAAAVAPAVRTQIAALDRELGTEQVANMDEVMSRTLAQPRFLTSLLGVFGLLALVLTATGVYGVMAYTVRLRMHEIGVRMALGADRSQIHALLLKQGARLAAVGIALGAAGALAITRVLASALYEVKPADPATFGAVAVLLAAVTIAANYVPAHRAAKTDPMVTLRNE